MENYEWTLTIGPRRKGGPGSGHHGHAGRPGKRGGSAPGKGGGGSENIARQPGGFYEEMSWEDLPKTVYHGTASDKAEDIQNGGLNPEPRSQGAMPLVSTSPSLDAAYGWGGGEDVIEIDTSKIKEGRVWQAPLFNEIAFERGIPASAISRIWKNMSWISLEDKQPGDKVIRAEEEWALVLRPKSP